MDQTSIHPAGPVTGQPSPLKAFLEIRLGTGPETRRVLSESQVVIGRLHTLPLPLEHHTVSRRHAELYCDPFARWWIRDLGSTNGTFVNDERVTERVLQPGDWIRVGDFALRFQLDAIPRARTGEGVVAADEERPTAIRTMQDLEPPRLSGKHLFTLMDLSRRLIGIEDPGERLSVLCQLMVREDFRGNVAMVLRMRKGGALTMLSGPHRPPHASSDAPPYISRRVLTSLEQSREPVLAGNLLGPHAPGTPHASSSPPSQRWGGGAGVTPVPSELTMSRDILALWVVACPLRFGEDAIDLLYVTLPPECGSVEWLGLISFAAEVHQQAEAAWAARRHAQAHATIERELEMARQIQRFVVPRDLAFPGLDLAVGFDPCKWVGGDYADLVPMPDGRMLLAVADVCGKGLQAALVASSLHTMVRATVDAGRTPTDLMDRVNRHLGAYLPESSFVTMVALAIDPVTGAMECVNAGHLPPLIVDAAGRLRTLQQAQNPALGVAALPMEAEASVLAPGEVVVMYTDGLTELRDASREMLGIDRLGAAFAEICLGVTGRRVDEIAVRLKAMLEEYRGDQLPEDDRAFIVARRG